MYTIKLIHKNLDNKLSKYKVTPFNYEKKLLYDKSIFPQPVKCLILGSSGTGKTTLLWNIIKISGINEMSNIVIINKELLIQYLCN